MTSMVAPVYKYSTAAFAAFVARTANASRVAARLSAGCFFFFFSSSDGGMGAGSKDESSRTKDGADGDEGLLLFAGRTCCRRCGVRTCLQGQH
jgi:hypothetical protein